MSFRNNLKRRGYFYKRSIFEVFSVIASLGSLATLSVWLGQDRNYDLANYHLYNGAALLSGRFSRDLLAAGMQSGFNPLLDALYAAVALGPLREAPRLLAASMGLWAGLTAYLAWKLALRLYPARPVLALIGVALAVTSAPFVAEIGTTFNDIQVAALMLGGLLVMANDARHWTRAAWAGALFGIAAGLKLTALVYAPAACVAIACLSSNWRERLQVGVVFSAGWLLGWLLADGWWAWKLWRLYQSPVFPLENGFFRSPWYPPANFVDARFVPANILLALIYPLYWYLWNPHAVGEIASRDPIGAITLTLGVAASLRWRPGRLSARGALLVFLGVGYGAWLWTSGIMRYALVLEIVSALTIPFLLNLVLKQRAAVVGLATVIALVTATTRYGSWGRAPYGAQTFWADTDWVRPGMLIVLTLRTPVAHIVPLLPFQKQISVIGLDFAALDARGWRWHDEAVRRIREHTGPIAVVTGGGESNRYAELGEVGLDPVLTGCHGIQSSYYGPNQVMVCEGKRLDPPPLPSPFWRQAAAHFHSVHVIGHGYGPLFGAAYLQAAGPPARGTRFLDWTDLLWSGVGRSHDTVPTPLDQDTLYVLADSFVAPFRDRMDPAKDALGVVDGVTVLAPGWRVFATCTVIP